MALDNIQNVSSNKIIQAEKEVMMPLESNNKREQNPLEDKPGTPSPAGVDQNESLLQQAVSEAPESTVGNLNYKSALLKKVPIPSIGQKKVQFGKNIEQMNPDTKKLKSEIHQRNNGAQNDQKTHPIPNNFEWHGPALTTNKPGLNPSFKMKPTQNDYPLGLKNPQRLKQIETSLRDKIDKVDHAAIEADMTKQSPIVGTVPKSEEIIHNFPSTTQESYLSVLRKHQSVNQDEKSQPEKHLSQEHTPIGTDIVNKDPIVETMPTVTKILTDPGEYGYNENQDLYWERIPINSKV
jgi:hypothetical protein